MNIVPFNEEFEKAVIISVLQDPNILAKISMILAPEDFYKERHREIFRAMLSLEQDSIDTLTVKDKLRKETVEYLQTLIEDSDKILPSSSNAMFYAESVKEKSQLRAGIDLGQQIIATCYAENDAEEAIHVLEDMFADFLRKRVLEDKSDSSTDTFQKFLETLNNRKPDEGGIRTGFTEIDLITQRMEGLIVLGARPGMGKTALAVNIATNVAKKQQPVLFFSLEQETNQIFERMLSSESEVPLEEIRLGAYKSDEVAIAKIEKAEKVLQAVMPYFHVDDKASIPTSYVSSLARQKRYEWGEIGLIVVDYLHIMKLNNRLQTVDALGEAVKELRALGKELGCPILLLSQLSRAGTEGRDTDKSKKNRRPELSDLRSSGEIEQSADMVWFVYRDSYYDQAGLVPDQDIAEVIVRKNRNGRQGIIQLEWFPAIVKFKNVVRHKR